MNLKSAAQIAAVIVFVSLPLTFMGEVFIYAPMLLHHFYWRNAINLGVGASCVFLSAAGVIVFFLAYAKQQANPLANIKSLYILAGSLILISALINALYNLPAMVNLPAHISTFRYMLFVMTMGTACVSDLCLSVFIFRQSYKPSAAKVWAAIALGSMFILCGATILGVITSQPWDYPGFLVIAGTVMTILGFLVQKIGVCYFLFLFLTAPTETPAAAAADSVTEPAL